MSLVISPAHVIRIPRCPVSNDEKSSACRVFFQNIENFLRMELVRTPIERKRYFFRIVTGTVSLNHEILWQFQVFRGSNGSAAHAKRAQSALRQLDYLHDFTASVRGYVLKAFCRHELCRIKNVLRQSHEFPYPHIFQSHSPKSDTPNSPFPCHLVLVPHRYRIGKPHLMTASVIRTVNERIVFGVRVHLYA